MEFTAAFSIASIGLLLLIRFILFATAETLTSYADYMRARSLRIHGDVRSTMVIQEQTRKACEDNPLWYIKGDEPCKQ